MESTNALMQKILYVKLKFSDLFYLSKIYLVNISTFWRALLGYGDHLLNYRNMYVSS